MASCISFMMNLYDAIVEADNLQSAELSKTQKMRQIVNKIQSSNLSSKENNSELNGKDSDVKDWLSTQYFKFKLAVREAKHCLLLKMIVE